MKITGETLGGQKSFLSSGKIEPYAAEGNKEGKEPEVKLRNKDPREAYDDAVFDWVLKINWTLGENLKSVLQARAEGKKVLTIREADIAARGQLDLNESFNLVGPEYVGLFLTDGEDPGLKGTPWELRAAYNRGVKYKTDGRYNKAPQEKKDKADEAMQKYLKLLREMFLPAWPKEERLGFPVELTKPEWMTWAQFKQAKKNPRRVLEYEVNS